MIGFVIYFGNMVDMTYFWFRRGVKREAIRMSLDLGPEPLCEW